MHCCGCCFYGHGKKTTSVNPREQLTLAFISRPRYKDLPPHDRGGRDRDLEREREKEYRGGRERERERSYSREREFRDTRDRGEYQYYDTFERGGRGKSSWNAPPPVRRDYSVEQYYPPPAELTNPSPAPYAPPPNRYLLITFCCSLNLCGYYLISKRSLYKEKYEALRGYTKKTVYMFYGLTFT